jgi:dipeptidase E
LDFTEKEKQPNILVIPTAKHTQAAYDALKVRTDRLYKETLGLPVEYLHDFDAMPQQHIIDELLEWADLAYISGGDAKRMVEIWRKYGIDSKLKLRAYGGMVLTGISAGAMAPFAWGHSDTERYYTDGTWDYQPVETLGLINAALTPHNDTVRNNETREQAFKRMFTAEGAARNTKTGIGVDNFAGISINQNTLRLRSVSPGAGGVLLSMKDDTLEAYRLDINQPIPLGQLGLD